MRKLHIIMPMAGEGSRFTAQGYTVPKPLIQVEAKPLYLRAIESLDGIEVSKRYSFIVRRQHVESFSIDKEILHHFPDANIFSVAQTTRGAVETCLMAREAIMEEDGLLVLDCDLEFHSSALYSTVREILMQPANTVGGGILLSFNSDNPRYSYAATDGKGRVTRTAEKNVISNDALAGSYFFSTGKCFLTAANQLLEDANKCDSELYMSLLYNYLIEAGQSVSLVKTDRYRSFGTPEELRRYAK